MNKTTPLNYLEHFLLSYTVDDMMPLYSEYRLAKQHIEEANLDSVLEAFVKLVKMGFQRVYYEDGWGNWTLLRGITMKELREHCSGRSEEKLREHPEHSGEFYFEATNTGKIEEAKDIYNAYYPAE